MFIFGFIIGIIALVSLALGITVDQVGCHPIRHPEKSNVIDFVDSYLQTVDWQVDSSKLNVQVREVLSRCYQNQSIYATFNLKKIFDLDTLESKFNISSYLVEMNKLIDDMADDIPNWTILSPDNVKVLQNLSKLDPSVNFDQFQDEVS